MSEEVLETIKNYFSHEKIKFYHADKKYSSTKGNYLALVGDKEIFVKIVDIEKLQDIVQGHKKMESFYALPSLIKTVYLKNTGFILMEKINGKVYSSFLNSGQIGPDPKICTPSLYN